MGRKVNILTVVGARPQFIKASVLSRSFAGMAGIEESIVHTGQHFDRNMSDLFFEELGIPDPDVNLGISGGSHAEMTARMLVALERVMRERSPDMVLVYGDTNSTLAASLAAAKLHMPLCHAEAGFRTHCRTNPEEVNRICTDHLASLNFAPTPQSIDNLIAEGLGEVSSFTGDLMYDAFQHARSNAGYKKVTLAKFDGAEIVVPTRYVYLTCHREENDSDATLCEVVTAANRFDVPVIYPVHPRVRDKVSRLVEELSANNVLLVRPVGYFESVSLTAGADLVVTDSGGLQREAFYAQVKCVTLLPFPSADETLRDDRNTLVSQVTAEKILEAARVEQTVNPSYRPFGQGDAAEKMVERIVEFFERGE